MKRLKERWGITSNFQIIIIFIVFAITGSTSAYFSGPLTDYIIGVDSDLNPFFKFIIRIIVLTPIYQVLLLFFGYIFLIKKVKIIQIISPELSKLINIPINFIRKRMKNI